MRSSVFADRLLKPDLPAPLGFRGKSERRFAVYRNNVVVGLVRALEANFPLVRILLGQTYFAGLAREFALNHPPQSALMFLYAAEFPAYLEAQDDLAQYPYLGDVARIEIALREAHHAADADAFSPTQLNGLTAQALMQLVLRKHPAARLLSVDHAAASVAVATQSGDNSTGFSKPGKQGALITRPRFQALVTPLDLAQLAFAGALFARRTLAEAYEAGAEKSAFDFAATLGLLLSTAAFATASE